MRFWLNLNSYRGLCVSGFGGFRESIVFSAISHIGFVRVDAQSGAVHTAYGWVTPHRGMGHVTCASSSRALIALSSAVHTAYGWVMSRAELRHVTCFTRGFTASHVWHDSFIRVPWLIHTCVMTLSHVCHDSLIRLTRLLYMRDMTPSYVFDMTHSYMYPRCAYLVGVGAIRYVWHGSLIHMCDMAHSSTCMTSYVWRDSFVCVPWLSSHVRHDSSLLLTHSYVQTGHTCGWIMSHIHICDVTPSHLCDDSLTRLTRLHYMCDMTPSYVCDMTHSCVYSRCAYLVGLGAIRYVGHDSFTCMTWLLHMCDVTPSYLCHVSFIYVPEVIHIW